MAPRRGFSLLDLLLSIAIVATLVGFLLPALGLARDAARTSMCASNLRQIGVAWQMYLQDHDQFPRHTATPDWRYGGVVFVGDEARAILDTQRPINEYVDAENESSPVTRLFRCPSDRGIFPHEVSPRVQPPSILPGDGTCYSFHGTSYRANPFLMDSTAARIDAQHRALRLSEVDSAVNPSHLLLMGDPAWFYSSIPEGIVEPALSATWHRRADSGNMLAVDGSIRFMVFESGSRSYVLSPNPEEEPNWAW